MPNLTETLTRWMPAAAIALAGCAAEPVAERPVGASLQPCPSAPHCVSSIDTDAEHHVDALIFRGTAAEARTRLILALKSLPRTKIVEEPPGYLHAESRSAVMRFVDDLEFAIKPAAVGYGGVIDVRSESRTGYYDFGVNRERVETLRKAFQGTAPRP